VKKIDLLLFVGVNIDNLDIILQNVHSTNNDSTLIFTSLDARSHPKFRIRKHQNMGRVSSKLHNFKNDVTNPT